MTPQTERFTEDIRTIRFDGDAFLAVRVADSDSSRSAKRFVEDGLAPGYVVHGDRIETWKPFGLKELEGTVYLYGPSHPGRTIDTITRHEPDTAIVYLHRLAQALEALNRHSYELPAVQTNGIFFLDDGGVLILPPVVLEQLRNVQTDGDRLRTYEIYNHPDLGGEAGVNFSLGVLWYRIVTGTLPFDTDDEVELHHMMREYRPVQPRLRTPEVREEVSTAIEHALDPNRAERQSLEELTGRIAEASTEGLFEHIHEDRKQQLLEQGAAAERRRMKAFSRRRFLRRHGRVLLWSGVGAILVASLATSIITNLTKPRVTLGMEPPEIVELFYSSITELDHQAIEDSVDDGVAKREINEATNLYVLTRVRLGNEGTTGLIRPSLWHENGRPQLGETQSVYGIDRLEITRLSETRFRAEYLKWEQVLPETAAYRIRDANATVIQRRDILTFEFDGTYWLITEIDREVDRYLEPEEVEELLE